MHTLLLHFCEQQLHLLLDVYSIRCAQCLFICLPYWWDGSL